MTADNRQVVTSEISVILAVYNGAAFLREALDSVLGQAGCDFDLIAVDDASTDGSMEILRAYAARDSRVVLIGNERNLGLARSLNRALECTRAPLVARFDADDVCLPGRLARQRDFMRNHPDVGVVGTAWRLIDSMGRQVSGVLRFPAENGLLQWLLSFLNPIVHPSVMLRRTVLDAAGGYDPGEPAEDYELWCRLSRQATLANLPDPLLHLRKHDANWSVTSRAKLRACSLEISRRRISELTGTEVAPGLVRGMWEHEFCTVDDALAAARLILDLCQGLLSKKPLTDYERRMIRRDAASRVVAILRWHWRDVRARAVAHRAWRVAPAGTAEALCRCLLMKSGGALLWPRVSAL